MNKTVYDLPKMTAKSIQKAFEERVNLQIQSLERRQDVASKAHNSAAVLEIEHRIRGLEDAKRHLAELVKQVD